MKNESRQTTEFSVWLPHPRESKRIDTFLSVLFPNKSRSYIQRLIDRGDVYINNLAIKKNAKIYPKTLIRIEWRIDKGKFEGEEMPLDIVFENAGFAVINKDAGLSVHPPGGDAPK